MKSLHDLFEEALKDWHDDVYLVRRKQDPAAGVYLWRVINRKSGQICRIFYDSYLQQFDCGLCRRRNMVDGHCRHSLLVRIDTYVTVYENDRPDENRRAVLAAAIEAVREKVGLADPEPESAGEEAEQSFLHDEDLYIEANEIVIPWEGTFYGASLLELTESAEGRAYLRDLSARAPDTPTSCEDDFRRYVDELIYDAARRVHTAICTTYADEGTRAPAA